MTKKLEGKKCPNFKAECTSNLNLSNKLYATNKEKIQEIILKVSFIKPLNVATIQEVRIIIKINISIILKLMLCKISISSNHS